MAKILVPIASKRINDEKVELIKLNKKLEGIADLIDDWVIYAERLSALMLLDNSACIDTPNCKIAIEIEVFEKRDTINKKIAKLKGKVAAALKNYTDEVKKFKDIKVFETDTKLPEADKKINEAHGLLKTKLEEARTKTNAENTKKILVTLSNVINNRQFKYTSLPMQLNGDQTTLKIKIEPRSDTYALNSYQTEIVFPQRRKSFIAAGSTFYLAWLEDEVYSAQKVIDGTVSPIDTSYTLVSENQAGFETGTSININFGWSLDDKSDWYLGIALGPGLSFTKTVRPRLLIGPSLYYGKRGKLVLGGGWILGYVDRLSNAVPSLNGLPEVPSTVVVSNFDVEGFVQLGYVYSF